MFNNEDIIQLKEKGIDKEQAIEQINSFKKGFPHIRLIRATRLNDGIKALNGELLKYYSGIYKSAGNMVKLKFVPASGAASRMFKALFEFESTCSKIDFNCKILKSDAYKPVRIFFDNIHKFAFYDDLKKILSGRNEDIDQLLDNNKFDIILDALLSPQHLNYGNLPKGLLKFHKYNGISRTAIEEHMVEGARYAKNGDGTVKIHFTVSPEHVVLFKQLTGKVKEKYESEYGVKFDISYSIQKPSTDTIAVDLNNKPFRTADGALLFRPGGHGALIENLDELDADIVFIKNIDNVLPDRMKDKTRIYKEVLAGVLLEYQEKIFGYLKLLASASEIKESLLSEIKNFIINELSFLPGRKIMDSEPDDIKKYLFRILNRPIRVCGMVKNQGESGGGPFWIKNPDGYSTLQIIEIAQINRKDIEQNAILNSSTHFNPVDIVCGIKDHKGKKFNLTKYIDHDSGIISKKSKDGKPLKALELPGLWNGAMSDWNTIFVEVPLSTFSPVKTVNDLLKAEHQQ